MSYDFNSACPHCPWNGRCRKAPPKLLGGCDLLIIGEGPGDTEVNKQEPFVGKTGELLKASLQRCGLAPEVRVSLTNATLCRPPTGKKLTMEHIHSCNRRLQEEIKAENPKVILALGNWAVSALTGDPHPKITQINGIAREVNGFTVIPCIHPAAVIRNGASAPLMYSAMQKAVDLANGTPLKHPGKTSYFVAREENLDRVLEALYRLPEGHLLGADIETDSLDPFTGKIKCFGIAWEKNKVIIFPGSLIYGSSKVRDLVASRRFLWVWHYGKFDVNWFRILGIEDPRELIRPWYVGVDASLDACTLMMHYSLCELRGTHDLETLSGERLGAADYKAKVEKGRKNGWKNTSTKDLYDYLAMDCDYTRQLYLDLLPDLQRIDGLEKMYKEILLPINQLAMDTERCGFWFNPEEGERVGKILDERIAEATDNFNKVLQECWPQTVSYQQCGVKVPPKINPGSPQQIAVILYDELKMKVPKGFKPRSTDKDVIKALPPHPILDALIAYRQPRKARSTYNKGIRDKINPRTGRVHAHIQPHGTATGRLSIVKPANQTIPGDPLLRGQYQAPPGRILLECDLDQAELRVLANITKDPELIAIYQSGRKLHHEVAVEMFGEDYDRDQYLRAKAVNFGIMYGREAPSLAKEFKIPVEEAHRMIRKWFERFPVAYSVVQKCRAAPGKGIALRAPSGRRRRFGVVSESNLHDAQNEAANFPIQSTASDITMVAGYRARPVVYEEDGLFCNLVHDSIIIELPDELNIRPIVEQYMIEAEPWLAQKKDPPPFKLPVIPRNVMRVGMEMQARFVEVGAELVGGEVPFEAEFKIGTKWGSLIKIKLPTGV